MTIDGISDHERLIVGLRLRLKHVRLAIAEAEAGGMPVGVGLPVTESRETMLAELRQIEADVLEMLRGNDAGEREALN